MLCVNGLTPLGDGNDSKTAMMKKANRSGVNGLTPLGDGNEWI